MFNSFLKHLRGYIKAAISKYYNINNIVAKSKISKLELILTYINNAFLYKIVKHLKYLIKDKVNNKRIVLTFN
jgi:hypothetical protein